MARSAPISNLGSGARIERIQVEGMAEFRRELRRLEEPKTWNRELSAAHKLIARDVAAKASARATAMGSSYAHFARAIRGYGQVTSARVGISSAGRGQRNWGANATFWGVKNPYSGWNANGFASGSKPNLVTEWVGNSWDIARGQGPVAIVDAIVEETPHIVERYGAAIEDIARRAFPD